MWVDSRSAAIRLGVSVRTVRDRAAAGLVKTRPTATRAFEYWVDDGAPPARAKSPAVPTVRLVTGIFDAHVPQHDKATFAAWLHWCRDNRPDEVIIGGDFGEMESASMHGGVASPASYNDEVAAMADALDLIQEANPQAKVTYLEGNHETRVTRTLTHALPTMAGAVSLPLALDLPRRHIEWVPYGRIYRVGKLGFTHGHWCSLHHAKKHLDEFGVSIMYGHTHKPQMFTKATADGKVHGAFGAPCMRTCDPAWMQQHGPSGWLCGFAGAYVFDNGDFTPYMVLANNGRFAWGGKVYQG